MQPRFIYIETFGCTANQNNSEILAGLIRQSGLEITTNPDIADLLIINTCIVKSPTEKKIERKVFDLLKNYPDKPIIIAGCMPEVRAEKLRRKNIYLLGTHHFKDILKLIKKISENSYEEKEFLSEKNEIKLCLPKIPEIKKIGITQISEGCNGFCSFCIVRLVKGKLFSYPQEKILENIENDLKSGAKEIWITSQDNATYGLDERFHEAKYGIESASGVASKGKRKLPELMRKILQLKGKFRVRLGMMNPENVLPILNELIEIYKNEKIYKFLHVPLQSGSNKILKLMNRKYTIEDFLKIIGKFRKQIPNLTLATDIIVAYPQETEQDFQETLNLIKKIKPDVLNVSKYWAMKGTPASKEKQIPKEIAKSRAIKLMQEYKKISAEKNKNYLEKETKVFVYDKFQNHYLARTENYKLVLIQSDKNYLGKFVNVKIIGMEKNHLVGEII